ncbi:60S ribosomal protein L6 [Favolaschia claudopus]|uniref:60S ribosomal protein L6 n=1 Tax=Favolaschia claudopus TaxID=2862362 RepID=A0AAW0E981_9AGAR
MSPSQGARGICVNSTIVYKIAFAQSPDVCIGPVNILQEFPWPEARISSPTSAASPALRLPHKKSEKPAAAESPETVEKQVGGDKNGGKRLVPTSKASRFYPAEDVRQPKKSRKSPKPASLRSSITPGAVLILLAGRFRGKRVVFLKQLESGLLLVTGPFKINGVPLRRVNQAYVDDKINDAYFTKAATKGAGSAEAEFFEGGKPKPKEAFPESKSADQKEIDKAIISSVKKTENLGKYLSASWGLSKGQFPHQLSLCDGFLDLAIALPFPPSVPTYTGTIVLVTVVSRLALFPIALWGRNRVRRLENVVLPEVERLKPIISKQVLDEMKQQGMRKEDLVVSKLQQMHLSRMMQRVKTEQKRLIAEHKCSPVLSMIASPASQLPVFVLMSMVFNRLAKDPMTPFDSEAFFTLTTLNHPDPTWAIPIILGFVTMANVESNNWLMTAFQRDRLRKADEYRAKMMAQGQKFVLQPHKIIKTALYGLSVGRIVLAGLSPGSVVLYWTTSAICGLIQTWILDYTPSRQSSAPASIQSSSAATVLDPPTKTVTPKPSPEPIVKAKSAKKQKNKRSS